MSGKTSERRRKHSCLPNLMLCKVIDKTLITSDEELFHLSFTTGKMKIQYVSREKRRKDATVLQKASWPLGVMVWM
ncbi:hypothetical protein TNCV_958601 [Trichonephila clavipes]|nr:hypothetical protein TNCV_958601 [Trichonephila clavipes]